MTPHASADPPAGLRARQSGLTRTSVFEALSRLLSEGDLEPTVQEVADRAGVSHRTIYRHFATRDDLFAAYADWLEHQVERAGGVSMPAAADDIAAQVRREHEILDAFGPAVLAIEKLPVVGERAEARRAERTRAIREALAEVTGHLEPGSAEAAMWVIRCLASSATWTFIRQEGQIDGRRSGEAVAWAIEALLDALRRGEGPGATGGDGARTRKGAPRAPRKGER